nr:hypothetical protein [Tanacetum cinerariifolium]
MALEHNSLSPGRTVLTEPKAEAIATTCFTQNRSLVIPRHEKTPYHIINDRKPSVKFFYIFGSVCYIVRDGENLDKMKEKGDECIFVGYSTQSRAYRVFNKRTRVIIESIHVNFDKLPQMASDQNSSDPAPECQTMTLKHNSLSPGRKCQENISHGDKTVTTLNELDLLFSPMFDELLNGPSQVVSKSSAVPTADESIQRQQPQTTPLVNHTTPDQLCQVQSHELTVTSNDNINQAELNAENDQVADDEFINIFSTLVQEQGETLSRHVDSSNMYTFYQRYPSKHRWTKDHPLEQVIGNPSQFVRTRRQLESDAEMCMFALTVSRTEPKNIKEAMTDSAWIESMQEELHQFDRLDVYKLVAEYEEGYSWGCVSGSEGKITMECIPKLPRTSSRYDAIWVIVDRLTKLAYFLAIRKEYKTEWLARLYVDEAVARHEVHVSSIPDRDGMYIKVLARDVEVAEIGESKMIGLEMEQETTKVVLIKERLKEAKDRVVRFGKKGKLAPRYAGPLEILEKIGPVASRLRITR